MSSRRCCSSAPAAIRSCDEELLRALTAGGVGDASALSSRAAELVPVEVVEAAGERMAQLEPVPRSALEWASVMPSPFGFEELALLGGREMAVAPEALERAGFLARDESGRWSFLHSILRDAVYQALPERSASVGTGLLPACFRMRPWNAVRRSWRRRAVIAILEQALERARATSLPTEQARLHLHLSYFAEMAGDLAADERHARLGAEIVGAPASLLARLRGNIAMGLGMMGEFDAALAHGLAAFKLATQAGADTEARLAVGVAYLRLWRGEPAAARRLLELHSFVPGSVEDHRAADEWGLLFETEGALADALAAYERGADAVDDPSAAWCAAGVGRALRSRNGAPSGGALRRAARSLAGGILAWR